MCGRRSDIWSLGCLILEMATGQLLPLEWGTLSSMHDSAITALIHKSLPDPPLEDAWVTSVLVNALQV